MIQKLFDVPVAIFHRREDSTIRLVISRVGLVNFCIRKLGLRVGNKIKHQVDIPNWVKRNKSYSIACLRGLVDTDGSVFIHKYKVKNKLYFYKKIGFTSRSAPLRQSVFKILKRIGLKARLSGSYDVRIDSQENVKKYFYLVGSNNQRKLDRFFD